jgi:hypothetical protein
VTSTQRSGVLAEHANSNGHYEHLGLAANKVGCSARQLPRRRVFSRLGVTTTAPRGEDGQPGAHYAALGGRSGSLRQSSATIERTVRSPAPPFTVCSASLKVSPVHGTGPRFTRSDRINRVVGMRSTTVCSRVRTRTITSSYSHASMTAAERSSRQRVSSSAAALRLPRHTFKSRRCRSKSVCCASKSAPRAFSALLIGRLQPMSAPLTRVLEWPLGYGIAEIKLNVACKPCAVGHDGLPRVLLQRSHRLDHVTANDCGVAPCGLFQRARHDVLLWRGS